ncbi:colicin I receptor [Escherichia coli KTE3]|nr:colicin I receptor [Escherichia coli KTE4]EOU36060.1 colicin I receptor [Escherichia coli KTE3]
MFRLNPFVRVGLCLSAISCAWPVLAVDDDGETMVVTASSVEQNLKDAPASISVITQEDLQRKPVQESEGCPQRSAWRTTDERRG